MGELLYVAAPLLDEQTPPRTPVRGQFTVEDIGDTGQIRQRRERCGQQLLRRINRLLRWYRTVTRRADITELTAAQVSPFRFEVIGGAAAPQWTAPLEYEAVPSQPATLTVEQTSGAVRDGLISGKEPEVDVLFLLDAERALQQGRFRESVLFCWSTIDSVFNRKYAQLVTAALAGEWSDALDFFTGLDFGLRNKMSAGMHLFANRSLFREPGGLWTDLSASYKKRNKIIHEGDIANEDEAQLALAVARRLVEIMNAIPVPAPAGVEAVLPEPPGPPGPAEAAPAPPEVKPAPTSTTQKKPRGRRKSPPET